MGEGRGRTGGWRENTSSNEQSSAFVARTLMLAGIRLLKSTEDEVEGILRIRNLQNPRILESGTKGPLRVPDAPAVGWA